MSINEYFRDWSKALDLKQVQNTATSLGKESKKAFEFFHLCPYNNLRVVMLMDNSQIFQQPYLDILRESFISLEVPHNHTIFDTSLEKWCRQGVLPLYCELSNKHGKDSVNQVWNSFVKSLFISLSKRHTAIIYLLIGPLAQTLRSYINEQFNNVLSVASVEREQDAVTKLKDMWNQTDKLLNAINGYSIQWYEEYL